MTTNYYEAPADIAAECTADYQALTGIVVDSNDLSRDEVVKFWWIATAMAHFYSRLQAASDNGNPETADINGLNSALDERDLPTQIQPTSSNGTVTFSGTDGTDFPFGTQIVRNLTGDIYVSQQDMEVSGGSVVVPFQSLATGQNLNIANSNEPFTLVAPITGITSASTASTPFAGARDLETLEAMLERVQAYDQAELTGGNLAAYEQYARDASDSVVTAKAVNTFETEGPDTVGIIITSGTTDIADAVNNGIPVVRLPSDALIAEVQAYVDSQNPTTDVLTVSAPAEDPFNVTFAYALYNESLRPQTDAAITNIIAIYLYSAASNYTLEPTDVERLVDQAIGFQIKSRRCSNFGGGVPPYTIPFGTIVKPGTITLNTYS